MNCVQPLAAWWSADRNEHGHHYAAFSLRAGCADRPVTLPCGKCVGCLRDKAIAWSVRCCHEAQLHERNAFVTLTYRDPAPAALCKDDLQRFFKRLRGDGVKFRYFAVGEYGSRTRRPHYHAIIFGQDFRDGSYDLGMGEKSENSYYWNPLISDCWGHGHVTIAPAEPGSIFYTAGYSLKNMGHDDSFHLVSKRPFLGAGWLARYRDDAIRNGFVTIDGRKYPVPPAYLNRKEYGVEFDYLRERRRQYVENLPPEQAGELARTARSREINILSRSSQGRSTI